MLSHVPVVVVHECDMGVVAQCQLLGAIEMELKYATFGCCQKIGLTVRKWVAEEVANLISWFVR